MSFPLEARVLSDGAVSLDWSGAPSARTFDLLFIRTGAVCAYTALRLAGDVRRYEVQNLSRHQRYLLAVLASELGGAAPRGGPARQVCSPWLSVTPRAGLPPRPEAGDLLGEHLARVSRLTVMPQDRRVVAYWDTTAGFVDEVAVEVSRRGRVVSRVTVEPEVRSLSFDAARGVSLENGETHALQVHTLFAREVRSSSAAVLFTPAPQGRERASNRAHPQHPLVYPTLDLSPEIQIFEEDVAAAPTGTAAPTGELTCVHCGASVVWNEYRLLCSGCRAEFVPNGRGEHLDLSQLRFGTCRCCRPKKILVGRAGSDALVCAHSGKEHIRVPGTPGYLLIEDLPHGLCQCCRPRRPLQRRGTAVVCSRSGEQHRNESGRYVLVPSQPIFDASAIDELLDAGLLEIDTTGVSRGRRSR
jgi:hypothetical protein